jgi:tyrosine-protein phosphatase YwqE
MFSFFKKKSTTGNYFPISTDIHSHILPGIDDGSPDLETSILLIKGLMELGVNRSVATPHIISDLYRNTPETIAAAQNLLQAELVKQQMDFTLSAAAEYMMDAAFFEKLNNGEPLLTVKDNLLLTEFSYMAMPENPKLMSFTIITNGYTPILAHPERYGYFHDNYKNYHLLQELGFKLQVNLLSLTGYYGPAVSRAGRYIIKNGLASFTATDLHHPQHLAALQDTRNQKIFKEIFKGERWNEEL